MKLARAALVFPTLTQVGAVGILTIDGTDKAITLPALTSVPVTDAANVAAAINAAGFTLNGRVVSAYAKGTALSILAVVSDSAVAWCKQAGIAGPDTAANWELVTIEAPYPKEVRVIETTEKPSYGVALATAAAGYFAGKSA